MNDLKLEDLNSMARDAGNVDDSLFKEQRSNIRLYRGDHYIKSGNRKGSEIVRSKDSKITKQTKLRITMNHTHRVCNVYSNTINNIAPSVSIMPNNTRETSDIKVAEMHRKLWDHVKENNNIQYQNKRQADNLTVVGECFLKVFWNPGKGIQIPGAIKQKFNAETGQPLGDPYQELKMSGDVDYEVLYGFNLKRDPSATEWEKCRWVMYEKMVDIKELEEQFNTKLKGGDSLDETFKIFDINTANYYEMINKNKKIMVHETYFRPSLAHPNGYYYISTDNEVLAKGELPLGVFPIFHAFFDEVPGAPRGYSIIKQIRSSQGEINRTISKIAEHQITLGDDTVYIQKGTKIAPGGYTNGVKAVQYSGIEPKVVQGRSGTQYVEHLNRVIDDMYRMVDISEFIEKAGTQDLMSQLYKNFREKEKFSKYAEKLVKYQKDVCKFTLKLYKHFAPDELLIEIIGKDEQMNLPELRSQTDLSYQIKLDEVTEDVDTKFAKMTKFTEIMQYNSDISPQVRGLIIKNMPFANVDEISKELTRPYEMAQNIILAIDRGQQIPIKPREDHNYMIEVLSARTLEADFQYLPQEVQMLYEERIAQHEELEVARIMREQELAAGFIPSGGDLVTINMTIAMSSEDGGTKTEKLKLPVEAINWLRDKLAQQGWTQEQLERLLPESRAEMGDMIQGQQAVGVPAGVPQF